MDNISTKVLIDPSLILAENSINRTLDLVKMYTSSQVRFEFYYPQSLRALTHRPEWHEERFGIKYFLGKAYPSRPEEVYRFIEDTTDVLSDFKVKAEQREKHAEFYDSLRGEVQPLLETYDEDRSISGEWRGPFDEDIINILFEEWVFLNESSWVVSRMKKPFTRFMAAGGVSLQFSKRATDLLIRKSLKKKDDELLSKVDRLRAFGKWVAVGGTSVGGIIADPFFATITPLVAGFFLLFDPDAQITNKELL